MFLTRLLKYAFSPESERPFLFLGKKRSTAWNALSKKWIKDHPCCAACGRSSSLSVHHIIPFHLKPEFELCEDNLISLCQTPCHLIFGHLGNFWSWNETVVDDCAHWLEKVKKRPPARSKFVFFS